MDVAARLVLGRLWQCASLARRQSVVSVPQQKHKGLQNAVLCVFGSSFAQLSVTHSLFELNLSIRRQNFNPNASPAFHHAIHISVVACLVDFPPFAASVDQDQIHATASSTATQPAEMPRNVTVATTQMEISRDPAKNLVCLHCCCPAARCCKLEPACNSSSSIRAADMVLPHFQHRTKQKRWCGMQQQQVPT